MTETAAGPSTWTREGIEALGPTTSVATTASILDASPDIVYALIQRGDWHITRVLRLGRKIVIPTSDLIATLYPERPAAMASATAGPTSTPG